MAAIAASLMCWGVAKCGSPAPNSTRSAPEAFSLAASATTAMVAEISIRFTRSLNCFTSGKVAMVHPQLCIRCFRLELVAQPALYQLRYQAAYRAAQTKDLLHQPRAQVRIRFRGHHKNGF